MHPNKTDNRHSDHDANGQPKATVAAQRYDIAEHHVLKLSRIFFVSFNTPETQLWIKAYEYGERVYGAPIGATIAHATLTMLNEMRCTRAHTFNYTDPRCADCSVYMTSEERYLMESFRCVRASRGTQARINAMLLCEGKDPQSFITAVRHLNRVLNTVEQHPDIY